MRCDNCTKRSMACQPIAWISKNAWTSKLKSMGSHVTMISRLISKVVNTRLEPQTVRGNSSVTWRASFSWVGKSCTKGTTTQFCFDAYMPSRLTIWWKRCMRACFEPMLVDPYWPKKLWELATIGSLWKATALNMWGRATVVKSIKIERMFLPNPCAL